MWRISPLDRAESACHGCLEMRSLVAASTLCLLVACGDDSPPIADGGPDAATLDMGPGVEIRRPETADPGPGLGNLTYGESELNQPIAVVDHDNGVPPPDSPARAFKPMGTNVAYMHHGWL